MTEEYYLRQDMERELNRVYSLLGFWKDPNAEDARERIKSLLARANRRAQGDIKDVEV